MQVLQSTEETGATLEDVLAENALIGEGLIRGETESNQRHWTDTAVYVLWTETTVEQLEGTKQQVQAVYWVDLTCKAGPVLPCRLAWR